MFAYAACCNATGTTCYVRTSPDGGIRQGDVSTVTCHQGETMLGCSTFSEDGHTAGANIGDMPFLNLSPNPRKLILT